MDEERIRDELAALRKKEEALNAARQKASAGKRPVPDSRAMRYAGLGLEFAAVFFGFVWVGHFLDERLGSKPWLVLVGICVGFGIALYRLIFLARRLGG